MLRRCYDNKADRYDLYGGAGVTVDKRWWCFDTFLNDIKELPGYNEDLFFQRKIQLDKDKLQIDTPKENRIYSKETCCWLSREEQFKYADHEYRHKYFLAYSPDGEIYKTNDQREFSKYFNLQYQNVNKCLKGHRNIHKGWYFKYCNEDEQVFTKIFEKDGDMYVVH